MFIAESSVEQLSMSLVREFLNRKVDLFGWCVFIRIFYTSTVAILLFSVTMSQLYTDRGENLML